MADSLRDRNALLTCGILASLVYVGTDILAANLYVGYSFAGQAVSELFAIGAPTSRIVVPLFTLSSVLVAAFGYGVFRSSGPNRALRVMAILFVADAINSIVLWNFFPMHMRGVATTFTDTMHLILAVNPFVLLSVVCGVVAFPRRFRFCSIGTIVVMLATAMVAFRYVTEVAASQPTPWLGLTERLSQYAFQLWQAALAIVLLRRQRVTNDVDQSRLGALNRHRIAS